MGAFVLWAFLGPLGPMDVGDRWAVWGTHMGRWGTHLILGVGLYLGFFDNVRRFAHPVRFASEIHTRSKSEISYGADD